VVLWALYRESTPLTILHPTIIIVYRFLISFLDPNIAQCSKPFKYVYFFKKFLIDSTEIALCVKRFMRFRTYSMCSDTILTVRHCWRNRIDHRKNKKEVSSFALLMHLIIVMTIDCQNWTPVCRDRERKRDFSFKERGCTFSPDFYSIPPSLASLFSCSRDSLSAMFTENDFNEIKNENKIESRSEMERSIRQDLEIASKREQLLAVLFSDTRAHNVQGAPQ